MDLEMINESSKGHMLWLALVICSGWLMWKCENGLRYLLGNTWFISHLTIIISIFALTYNADKWRCRGTACTVTCRTWYLARILHLYSVHNQRVGASVNQEPSRCLHYPIVQKPWHLGIRKSTNWTHETNDQSFDYPQILADLDDCFFDPLKANNTSRRCFYSRLLTRYDQKKEKQNLNDRAAWNINLIKPYS